jgi:hypothetical protein
MICPASVDDCTSHFIQAQRFLGSEVLEGIPSAQHSLYADWSSADRPAEMHIFTRCGHGFGVGKRGLAVDRWTDLLGDWLADQGFA